MQDLYEEMSDEDDDDSNVKCADSGNEAENPFH